MKGKSLRMGKLRRKKIRDYSVLGFSCMLLCLKRFIFTHHSALDTCACGQLQNCCCSVVLSLKIVPHFYIVTF